jgi:hypothetical protein
MFGGPTEGLPAFPKLLVNKYPKNKDLAGVAIQAGVVLKYSVVLGEVYVSGCKGAPAFGFSVEDAAKAMTWFRENAADP